jgi:hypothetical protein
MIFKVLLHWRVKKLSVGRDDRIPAPGASFLHEGLVWDKEGGDKGGASYPWEASVR